MATSPQAFHMDLNVTMGQSVFDLARAYPALIKTDVMKDNSPVIIDQVTQLTLQTASRRLRLPLTRFVMIYQVAAVVVGVDTSPSLSFLDLAASHELAQRLMSLIEESGWTAVQREDVNLDNVARGAQQSSRRYEKTYAKYRDGDNNLRLYLKEAAGTGLEGRIPPAKGNLFLVNIDVFNSKLDDEMNKKLFEKRNAATGTTNSQPLSVWRAN